MITLPLYPLPSDDWQEKYDTLLRDPYLYLKYDRDRRLRDKWVYIDKFLPEIYWLTGKVLDIGPGPGEFLEVCRNIGLEVCGIDAPIGESEMGNEYSVLSKMMTERQRLKVVYDGVDFDSLPFCDNDFMVVNSQGSIEQVFRDYMIGIPHRVHKNAGLLEWNIGDGLTKAMSSFLKEVYRILDHDGILMIYGNGAKNVGEYDDMVSLLSSQIGFKPVIRCDGRLHKWRKP